MGVRVLSDGKHAALYDSVGMLAFGPVFGHENLFASPEDAATDFLNWLQDRGLDVRWRRVTDLVADRRVWLSERAAQQRVAEKRTPRALDHSTHTEEDAAEFHRVHGEDYA